MFIKDLYPYKSRVEEDGNNLVAVGWLSDEIEFEIGAVPLDFRDKLSMLCSQPIRKSRGFHVCPFCTKDDAETGNGEIHVAGLGCIYVAPALIGHYVAVHSYKPPSTFVEAVRMKTKDKPNDMSSELTKKVIHLADSPSEQNKWAFYKCLLRDRVGIRVPRELGTVPSGDYVTTAESDLRIPTAKSPTGEDMLLVLTDVGWLQQHEPGSMFVEMDGRDLLRLALDAGAGVIVQVLGPGRQAWSGVPADDVRQILVTG